MVKMVMHMLQKVNKTTPTYHVVLIAPSQHQRVRPVIAPAVDARHVRPMDP